MTQLIGPGRLSFTGADGNTLVADAWGAGPPVLLLHGGGQTRYSWERTARRLADADHRAIAVDLRGHGESDWSPDGVYTMSAHVADLDAICSSLGEPATLVGASMGGVAALRLVGDAPDGGIGFARSLVLVDVTPQLEAAGVSRVHDFMRGAPDGFASLEEAAATVAAYLPGRPTPRSTDGLSKNLRLGADGRYRWHWDPRILDGLATDAGLRHDQLVQAASRVRIPSLVVRGAKSDVVSADGVREVLGLIPHSEFVEISDAGHMVAGDNNDPFSTAIVEFVLRH